MFYTAHTLNIFSVSW